MANTDPYIGEVALFAGFVPEGWLPCDGRLLAPRNYTALFSLIGFRFGGDGKTTFALPDLRGAVPIGAGAGPGLSSVGLGARVGSNSVALTADQAPHSHLLQRRGVTGYAQKTNIANDNAYLGQLTNEWNTATNQWELVPHFASNTAPDTQFAPDSISQTGGGGAHENRQPFVALMYGIAYDGLFPSRP